MSKKGKDLFGLCDEKNTTNTTNQLIVELILGGFGAFLLFFLLPVFLVSGVLFLCLRSYSKKSWEWISLGLAVLGLGLFFWCFSWRPLLQFGGIWRFIWADGVEMLENLLQNGVPFQVTYQSWLGFACGIWCFTSVFLVVYRKLSKTWLTHEKEEDKRKLLESDTYQKTFKKKNEILEKRQLVYRKSEEQKVYVGMNTEGKDIFLDIASFFTHCFVQGTTGSGKTVLMYAILEGALRNGIGGIFIDGKGDPKTEREISQLAQAYHKKIHVFSDCTDLHYNPVRFGKPTAIKDRLMATLDWSESFYEKESENMLQMIINFVNDFVQMEEKRATEGVERPETQGKRLRMDLQTIHRFLDLEELATYLFIEQSEEIIHGSRDLTEKVKQRKEVNVTKDTQKKKEKKKIQSKMMANASLHEKYIRYFFNKDQLTYGDIEQAGDTKEEKYKLIQGLRTQLELLIYSDLGEKFLEHEDAEKNLNIFSALMKGEIVLISLNSNDYSGFIKSIGRFLIADIAHCVTKLYSEAGEGFLGAIGFFDEFGSYGSRKIIDIVSKARSAKLGGVIGTQSFADLVTEEGDLTGSLIDNSNLFFLGRSNDPDHAEYSAKLAGTYADIDRTIMTENKGGKLYRIDTKEERGTIRDVRKFVFDPDMIKELKNHMFVMVDKTTDALEVSKEHVYTRNVMENLLINDSNE